MTKIKINAINISFGLIVIFIEKILDIGYYDNESDKLYLIFKVIPMRCEYPNTPISNFIIPNF
ncbi:hypothetical protein A3G56_00285 [Candidatus Falkowbacteria bacterium RIFCSPLOWO2_12_FULL_45_10]|uniref:Uncharacterized protein n=2 Tax=Candidatus Falkowiibacteriota TaxID=1752728 RepID=A0A1F5RVD2_9BACT|nr:MAG: hypothetical protein A3D54_02850 [Candidatus Falkowbacteria bacterium RIFCSPHIGHO2_02_FULL_45_15]OGF18670.1 MAG: hypothetical protein A3G56_00285 [Candidatus Falkowbacteria bacterium RIFCSPLOWO2_12_FULL_45_10]